MADKATKPNSLDTQSTPKKSPLRGSTSSTEARNEFIHSYSNHREDARERAPQSPIGTQLYRAGSHGHARRNQDTHQLLQSGEQQPLFDPFIFVNEQELQQPSNTELRHAIRSHVRKGAHIKKKRLNAASKPESNNIKKILKRPPGSKNSHSTPSTESKGLPLRIQNIALASAAVDAQSARQLLLPSDLPTESSKAENSEAIPVAAISVLPHTFARGPGTLARDIFGQIPAESFFRISRHQLDSSKFTPWIKNL